MRQTKQAARMGDIRNAFRNSFINPERKRPVGKPKRRCEDNINKHLKEMGPESVFCVHMA
jgi:hypothetical protein